MTYYDINGNPILQNPARSLAGMDALYGAGAADSTPTQRIEQGIGANAPSMQGAAAGAGAGSSVFVGQSSSGSSSSSSSSGYMSPPSNAGSYNGSGDKYANVGTPQSYNPNYGMNYNPSAVGVAYQQAMQQIAADLGSAPTYNNKYDIQLESAYNNIVNRDPFSYNADEDSTYGIYKDRYTKLGQQAMKDTMGQAAALTGGYGNTYAQNVGQAAYGRYMDALADKSLELEQIAYQRYQDAGTEMYRQYQLLEGLRDNEYGKYRDQVSDYNYKLALLQAQEAEDYARQQYLNQLAIQSEQVGYDRYRDAMADARYEDELGYSRYRDTISDQRYDQEWQYQLQRDQVKDSQWQQEFDWNQQKYYDSLANSGGSGGSGGSSGGSRGGGGSGSNGSGAPDWWSSMSTEERKNLQAAIGTDADGIWGPNTKAAYEAVYGSGSSGAVPIYDNGNYYSLDGYDGNKIYTTAADQAAQQFYEDQFLYDGIVKILR